MKTTRLLALGAIAVLTLAACGSGEDDTSDAAADPAVENTDTAGDADSADDAADTDGAADDSAAGVGNDGPEVVLSGDLDEQSLAWFTEFCSSLAPIASAEGLMGGEATTDLAAQQSETVAQLAGLATVMEQTSTKLADMPAPTINGGDELATLIIDGLADAAPALQSTADELAAVDSTDDELLEQHLGASSLAVLGAVAGSGIMDMELDSDLQASLMEIPQCAPFAALGAGLAG